MEKNQRFTILPFPQRFENKKLKLNIVFLPRNQNPLKPAIEGEAPAIPDAPAFVSANLSFSAKIITGLSGLPTEGAVTSSVELETKQPDDSTRKTRFKNLAEKFEIKDVDALNTNYNIQKSSEDVPDLLDQEHSVKKYLPISYRKSFNFIAPRTKNAVIDDTYHCQVKAARPKDDFKPSPQEIRWGQVFAHVLRQPHLAKSIGMIFETELEIEDSFFPKGGWLYIDLADSSDYKLQQEKDNTFIKKYAARIPVLEPTMKRNVFASLLFPVLPQPPPGNYDELFKEAAKYDDGFGKIVHAFQPVSNNLLVEESDGFHPTKEMGIRLGWDDEQILIWYMRQLMADADSDPNNPKRIDAPLGVYGYRIDVRKNDSSTKWDSLNLVECDPSEIDDTVLREMMETKFEEELNYQVYPSRLDGDKNKCYWLPMYFANWNGKSIVLPDDDAIRIYQSTKDEDVGAPKNNLNKIYTSKLNKELRYGKTYQFRVRLADLSGGGPKTSDEPTHETTSQIATCDFKRYVAPGALGISNLPVNTEECFGTSELKIMRPLLDYPAVVFTGKYQNPVDLLEKASEMAGEEAFGIADPDVESVEITIEVKTLKMDNLMSVSGKESYIKFYTTTRKFPETAQEFKDELVIPIEYKDCKVLKFGNPTDFGDFEFSQGEIDQMKKLVLPSSRVIRLTLRPVCKDVPGYYGLTEDDPKFNTRYGQPTQLLLYSPPKTEENLLIGTNIEQIQGIYLQPDPFVPKGDRLKRLLGNKNEEKPPNIVQRLAQQLGLEQKGLTLVGKKGERVQFGCSNKIRHTLSPDNSSITFANKKELTNHWLCCIVLQLNRDWTWDALKGIAFVINRKKRFREDDPSTETEETNVGEIEIKKTAPFNALTKPQRDKTTLIFIDAVEPKTERKQSTNDQELRFPDVIELHYTIDTKFKENHPTGYYENGAFKNGKDKTKELAISLPISVQPAQVPKIVSAGLALSPYKRNKKYSATEPRRRFLWIEFDEAIKDTKDAYFARVLNYAPDQLISNNNPELLVAPEEPTLPIDPEYVRTIIPNQPNDEAGIYAMQLLEKATDSDRHYLLPLPPGLEAESPEMFGFFTYEFRVGHYKYTDASNYHQKNESVWTTAQGRFGRPLRATGVQHPAPTLTCTVNRDEEKLYVTAPYATAVHNGKNVTADPPRTEIWCLLYVQVKQADNKDFRNILLDDKILDPEIRVQHHKETKKVKVYTREQLAKLKTKAEKNTTKTIDVSEVMQYYKLADLTSTNKDANKFGTVIWTNKEINQFLSLYALPIGSALSVLCVEILPQITNICEHINNLETKRVQDNFKTLIGNENFPSNMKIKRMKSNIEKTRDLLNRKPLSYKLGYYRILRTSALNEVPPVCKEAILQKLK